MTGSFGTNPSALSHGLDAVNADSGSLAPRRENFAAAATSETFFTA